MNQNKTERITFCVFELVLFVISFQLLTCERFFRFWEKMLIGMIDITLVETAWTFYKFLKVTKLIFHDFIKFSRRLPCIRISLIQFNFIKLPIRCILNLAAILRGKVLQVSLRRRSNFKSSWDLHQFYRAFNANKLQSHYKFQSSVIFSVLFD